MFARASAATRIKWKRTADVRASTQFLIQSSSYVCEPAIFGHDIDNDCARPAAGEAGSSPAGTEATNGSRSFSVRNTIVEARSATNRTAHDSGSSSRAHQANGCNSNYPPGQLNGQIVFDYEEVLLWLNASVKAVPLPEAGERVNETVSTRIFYEESWTATLFSLG